MKSLACLAVLLALSVGACARDEIVAPPDPILVTVTPASRTIAPDEMVQMQATVKGRADQSVVWSIVLQGATNVGVISPQGLYGAPATVPEGGLRVQIVATATGDTARGFATITVVRPPADALVRPGAGSSYTYAGYSFDTAGRKIPGSETTIVEQVTASNIRHEGRDSALIVAPFLPGLTAARLLSSGNVELWSSPEKKWVTIPFAGGSPDTVVLYDSLRPNGTRLTERFISAFTSSTVRTILGKSYKTFTAKLVREERRTGAEWYSIGDEYEFVFVPALGWYWSIRRTSFYDDAVDHIRFGTHAELTAFERK